MIVTEIEYCREIGCFTDDQIFSGCGIKNWSSRIDSFTKILNNHSSFLHDKSGIFFVDQVALTYTSQYQHLFFKWPQQYRDEVFTSRYTIDEELVLVAFRGKERQYHKFYVIEFNGKEFGELQVHKTSNEELSRIQIGNEILYTEPPLSIIYTLVKISTKLGLRFCNYCNYDVAYDSITNYYRNSTLIYYQSDLCAREVHEAYDTEPKYTSYGKRRFCNHVVDPIDNTQGTFYIGSKHSATSLRIYPKTPDNILKGKTYITNIHDSFFHTGVTIYRIEGCARSEFFYSHKKANGESYDFLDLISPDLLKRNFRQIIGDKLKFRSIKAKGWDDKRNPIFEMCNVVEFSDYQELCIIDVAYRGTISEQNKQIKQFKEITYRYLEDKVPYRCLVSFVLSQWPDLNFHKRANMITGLMKATRNHKNAVPEKKRRILMKFYGILERRIANKHLLWLRLHLLAFI